MLGGAGGGAPSGVLTNDRTGSGSGAGTGCACVGSGSTGSGGIGAGTDEIMLDVIGKSYGL